MTTQDGQLIVQREKHISLLTQVNDAQSNEGLIK